MKKVFVCLFVVLALLSAVACKQGLGDSTPVETDGGTITVKPAEGAVFSQTDRFQFIILLKDTIKEDDSVSFLLKLSDSFKSILPRSGKSGFAKFESVAIDDSLETNNDGWYLIDVDATENTDSLGITAYLSDGIEPDGSLFVSIKNLKIGGKMVDFGALDADSCVAEMVASPNLLKAEITK